MNGLYAFWPFDGIVDTILHDIQGFWQWLMGILSSAALAAINYALSTLPTSWQTSVETVRHYLEVGNAWLPLDYVFQLWIAYLVFEGVWWVMRVGLSVFGVRLPCILLCVALSSFLFGTQRKASLGPGAAMSVLADG